MEIWANSPQRRQAAASILKAFLETRPQRWVAGIATLQGTVTAGICSRPLSGLQWTMPEALRTPVVFCEAGPLNWDAQGAHSKATPCSQGHRRGPLDTVTLSLQEGGSHLQPRGSLSAQPWGDSESPDHNTSCCDWVTWPFIKSSPWGVWGERKETEIEKLLAHRSGRRRPQKHRGLGRG